MITMWTEAVIKGSSQKLLLGVEGNNHNPFIRIAIPEPKFEPGTSPVLSRAPLSCLEYGCPLILLLSSFHPVWVFAISCCPLELSTSLS
jgi:hypothetical protein